MTLYNTHSPGIVFFGPDMGCVLTWYDTYFIPYKEITRIDGIPPTVTYDGKEWEVVV